MLRLGGAYLQVSLEITKSGAKVLMRCKILPYSRARVQGAQGLHQAEAKIGLPTGLYTQLKK